MPRPPEEQKPDDVGTPEAIPVEPQTSETDSVERRPSRSRARSAAVLDGDELRLRLSSELHRILRTQCHPGGWRVEDLVTETLRHTLVARSPAIFHGDRLLASEDVCRFWSRNPLETGLRLRSDRGTFLISTHPESGGYHQWRQHFTTLGLADPDREARQMRLIQLQEAMGSVEDFAPSGWRKEIRADDFIVTEGVLNEAGSTAGGGPGDRRG